MIISTHEIYVLSTDKIYTIEPLHNAIVFLYTYVHIATSKYKNCIKVPFTWTQWGSWQQWQYRTGCSCFGSSRCIPPDPRLFPNCEHRSTFTLHLAQTCLCVCLCVCRRGIASSPVLDNPISNPRRGVVTNSSHTVVQRSLRACRFTVHTRLVQLDRAEIHTNTSILYTHQDSNKMITELIPCGCSPPPPTHLEASVGGINGHRDGSNNCHGSLQGSLILVWEDVAESRAGGANVGCIELALLVLQC